MVCNDYDGMRRDSNGGHVNCSRDFTIVCNSYGGEGSYCREASSVSSRHGNSGSYGREFAAADKNYGVPERSDRKPFFVTDGNTRSPSFHRESPSVSSSNDGHQNFSREYPTRLGREFPLVSNGYGAPESHSRESLSDLHNYASHGSLGRASSTASPFQNATVSVFWDLDNKPPKSSPYHAALYLRKAASQFGSVIDMVAYANRHAFTHVPDWVREQRRDRKQLDVLERRGVVQPEQPYVCNLCGRKCKTNLLLKKHFKQLHEREHNKRMTRLNSLKGKKRTKFKESVLSKTVKYREAARPILVPKVGYGLESDLRRAGVYVRTVQYKPQAADIALKQQMAESMSKGIKCLCLVSDDTDFAQMLVDARALNLRTIVFGESKSLKRFADLWFPWDDISHGVPVHDCQETIRAWTQHHNSIQEQNRNILAGSQAFSSGYGMYRGASAESDVQHKIFAASNPMRKTSFSVFSEEEPVMERDEDVYESSSDDDVEFAFEDVDDELDGDWEDDFDDGSIEMV